MDDGRRDGDPGEVDATTEPVKSARRSSTCPRCGSHDIAEIQYGEPAYSTHLEADREAHRVVLGGCVVRDDQPDRTCTGCGLEFRADGVAPVLDPTS